MKIADLINDNLFQGTDPRTRYYLYPKRIMRTEGNVSCADAIFEKRAPQIAFEKIKSDFTVLKNEKGKAHASLLLDFGKEIHGSARVHIQYAKPKNVHLGLRFGESVSEAITKTPDGGATNDHAVRDFSAEVSFMGYFDTPESGFRFLNIELLDEEAEIGLKAVFGVLIVRDIEYRGSFESSDKLLDKIFSTAAYTAHLNMQEYLWDGVKRDRLVWIGDMHPEIMTICSIFGDNDVVRRSLDLSRDVTTIGSWMVFPSYSMWWMMCHFEYYMQNGDIKYLSEQGEYMSGLVDSLIGFISDDGRENLPDPFLDWPTRADKDATHAGIQALFVMTMEAAEYLFTELRNTEYASKCKSARERLLAHKPKSARKQAAALLSLSGIADAEQIDRDVISVGGGHGYSTFFSYYILAARSKAGMCREALCDMRSYYGAMLELGATSFWEDFDLDWIDSAGGMEKVSPIDAFPEEGKRDIHKDYGAYCYVGLRHSLCHGWSSGPVPFLMRHVLGVEIIESGCRKIRVSPNLCGLEYVRGEYPTPFGNVKIYADKNGVSVDAPDGVTVVS